MGKTVKAAFEEYQAARRLLLLWAAWLITYTVIKFFENLEIIQPHHNVIVLSIIGILTTVIMFYQWHRGRDNVR